MGRYNKNRYGSIVLQDNSGNNFTITKKEQAEIKKYVKRANEKRKYYSEKYYQNVVENNNMKGISQQAYNNLLNKKGFITEKYSTSFTQFKSKEDVKDFIKELKTVNRKGYYNHNKKVKEIKESIYKQIDRMYGEQGKDIKKVIKNINDNDFMSLYIHNDEIIKEIYYSDNDVADFINKTASDINVALKKMKG